MSCFSLLPFIAFAMLPKKRRIKNETTDFPKTEKSDTTQLLSKRITKLENITPNGDDSSSESDIENYLQPSNKIDLNSLLYDDTRKNKSLLEMNENSTGVDSNDYSHFGQEAIIQSTSISNLQRSYSKKDGNRKSNTHHLFDSEKTENPSTSKSSIQLLHEYTDYTKKMEETRKYVDNYNARKTVETEKHTNIYNLLATGEAKFEIHEKNPSASVSKNFSDFESCSDSDYDNWEEVEEPKDRSMISEREMQITVEVPGHMKKKKKEDIFASIKRRINNIRKKNQILVHKVHLLCWIGHGNHLNSVINSNKILSVALSLLPSDLLRRPSKRTDLNSLEELLEWFKRAIPHVKKVIPDTINLENILLLQMNKSEAWNNKMLVYIFVTILRSLGIQCRLVLSFQVEPVRPPDSELCSLSTKNCKNKSNTCQLNVEGSENERTLKHIDERAKEEKGINNIIDTDTNQINDEETSNSVVRKSSESNDKYEKCKRRRTYNLRSQTKILQLDGVNDSTSSDDEVLVQLTAKTKKKRKSIAARSHTSFKIKLKNNNNTDSEDDFDVKSPFTNKNKDSPNSILRTNKSQTNLKTSNSSPTSSKGRNNDSNKIVTRTKKEIDPKEADNNSPSPITRSKIRIKRNEANKEKPCPKKIASSKKRTNNEIEFPNIEKNTKKSPRYSPKINKTFASTSKLLSNSNKISTCITKTSEKKIKPLISMKNASELAEHVKNNANKTKSKKRRTSEDDFYSSMNNTTRKLPTMKKNIKIKKTINPKNLKESVDVWAEVYLEAEGRWACVDVTKGQIDCIDQLYARATQPVLYTVAWTNDGSFKDISSKYCQNFNTSTRRLRIDCKWWWTTLELFKGKKTAQDKLEDEELEKKQLNEPIPKTIKEYKNHPLYVLKRHLLKYEAIYPPEAPSLGFCRNEPVYSRQCVFNLHPRYIWLKQAKIVKPGETAYKIVKGRPRWDKLSHSIVTDPEEEVFGPWQVQDFDPPTAENGLVPRNEYGNVELFKPCMLPKKTVHLRLPGLGKIAKRMNIDCAPAFTGFDYSDGWIHPAYDGFVVCEEFGDVLVAAWELEQDEIKKREQEKIDKRVYANWKIIIKGLLIREKLKAKYAFGDISSSATKKRAKGPPKFTTKKRKM